MPASTALAQGTFADRRPRQGLDDLPAGIAPDGVLQVASSTWFVYGRTTYDGEVVLASYEDADAAARALRSGAHARRSTRGGLR